RALVEAEAGELGDVGARGEVFARAAQQHGLHRRMRMQRQHMLLKLRPHLARDRIELARMLQHQLDDLAVWPVDAGHLAVHHFAPITAFGSAVAMPGNTQISITANSISVTKGSTPQMICDSEMSGAMFLMTKMFSPTGGWMRPVSITMVISTPNHTRSKP